MSIQDIAKFYGLNVNRSGMTCCPFHEDSTPSLKVYDDHFYCFGCSATGDCTGFTAKLFGITQLEAAKKISYDFGLHLFDKEIAVSVNKAIKAENDYYIWLKKAKLAVSEYLDRLTRWRKIYMPKDCDEQLHPLFVESLQKTGYIQYLSDLLTCGMEHEKRDLYKNNRDDIAQIQKRLGELAVEEYFLKRKAI